MNISLFIYFLAIKEAASSYLRPTPTETLTATSRNSREMGNTSAGAGAGAVIVAVEHCDDCHTYADCVKATEFFECICSEGYKLAEDGQTCVDRDECEQDEPCSKEGGYCVDHNPDDGFYSCGCIAGYSAALYDEEMNHPVECTDQDECFLNLHNCDIKVGICTNTAGSFECSCPTQYSIDSSNQCIQQQDVTEDTACSIKNCDNTTSFCELEADNATAVCLCLDGFFQIGRGAACHDENECNSDNECHSNAQCYNLDGSHLCICKTGFVGNGLECEDDDECLNGVCGNELMCVNLYGGYTCQEFPSSTPSLVPSSVPSSNPTVTPEPTKTLSSSSYGWLQYGQTLEGSSTVSSYDPNFGRSVSLSSDGTIMAIGTNHDIDGNGKDVGSFSIYKLQQSIWTQVGDTVFGPTPEDSEFGREVSLSADGMLVAVGSDGDDGCFDRASCSDGFARVYGYIGNQWIQIGSDLAESGVPDFGENVQLSGDGTTVAVSAPRDNELYVYRLGIYGDWEQLGDHTNFLPAYFKATGAGISLSNNGGTIAVGSPEDSDPSVDLDEGSAVVYTYNTDTEEWDQVGDTLYGDSSSGEDFGEMIALSEDGNVVAISDPYINSATGRVYVYSWTGTRWSQVGQTLDGKEEDQTFGSSLSLNAAGTILAIGSQDGCSGLGYVNVYQLSNNVWSQLGSEFEGETNVDDFGRTVSLSDSGLILATGANDAETANGSNAGAVKVFRYTSY